MTAFTLPKPSSSPPARRRGAAALALAVLAAHAWLLGSGPLAPALRTAPAREAPGSVQVRRVVATPGPAAAQSAAPAAPPALQLPPGADKAARAGRPAPAAIAGPARADGAAADASVAAAPAADFADHAPHEATAAAPGGGAAIPVYATRLPPPATLRYALQRGAATGQAELRWQPSDGRYELSLSGPAFAAQRRAWVSRGTIDAHGIAPERYAESRRGRELRAANFQRESGRITFSGPSHAFDWVPGAQDRLSWMLQLAAIVAADPALQAPGARVTMLVAGAGGVADAWDFVAVAQEAVELPGGDGAQAPGALRWRREAARPWDTEVEVWLDPARHHLPLRARLRVPGSGWASEWALLEMTAP